MEYCGVARFLYVDFPLGNPCGKPYDNEMQLAIVKQALGLFDSATAPFTTVRAQYSWSDDQSWRDSYARVDPTNLEVLRMKGQQRRQQQAVAKVAGESRAPVISE